MPEGAVEALRNEIADLRRLIHLVTDEGVRSEIRKMINELERRFREIEEG
jgi:hypothetical protein